MLEGRVFRPRAWSIVATVLLGGAFLGLGNWQLDRAAQKRARYEHFERNRQLPPLREAAQLRAGPDEILWRQVRLQGEYDPSLTVLLDNQVRNARAGYHVLTPFRLADGSAVLVDRGWIEAGGRGTPPRLPPPAGAPVSGILAPPPAAGIRLNAQADAVEPLAEGVLRVQRLDPVQLAAWYPVAVPAFLIYADGDGNGGLAPVSPAPADRGERHDAYALQWFSFAGILALLFVALNWKADPDHAS